jgi:hypothetical protein
MATNSPYDSHSLQNQSARDNGPKLQSQLPNSPGLPVPVTFAIASK